MALFEQQTQPQYIHSTIKMTEYLKLCLGKLICVGARRPAAAGARTREPLGCKICVMLVVAGGGWWGCGGLMTDLVWLRDTARAAAQ